VESFGRYIAVILVIGLAFLIPMSQYAGKLNKMRETYIIEAGEEFVKRIEIDKVVLLTEWERFCEKLNRYGGLCQAELTVGDVKKYREGMGDGGEFYQMSYDYEIKESLFRDGSYVLKEGVFVMVKIYEKKGVLKRVYFERARKID